MIDMYCLIEPHSFDGLFRYLEAYRDELFESQMYFMTIGFFCVPKRRNDNVVPYDILPY